MAFDVDTKDCTALADTELAEMADMVADGPAGFDIGLLSKQAEEWVLVTQVRDAGKLAAFSFCTLERIGGTPCLLWGLASVERSERCKEALEALVADQYRRVVLAFPDEDVLVGARFLDAGAFAAFEGLEEICPRPGHKPSGEERAWSRRLAKRFGCEGRIDDRSFVVSGDGSPGGAFDYRVATPGGSASGSDAGVAGASDLQGAALAPLFQAVDPLRRDVLIAFGWAMAEDLADKYGS